MKSTHAVPAAAGWSRSAATITVVLAAITGGLLIGRSTIEPSAPAPQAAPVIAVPAAPSPSPAPADDSTIPRIRIDTAGAPGVGPASASVTIVEFIDYQCPFCGRARPTVEQVLQRYGDKARVVYMQYPLDFHPDAPLAAQAALAAHAQGKFAAMHELLLANQKALKRPQLEEYASRIGLDLATFRTALDQGTYSARVEADVRLASEIGATATPYFFVNGRALRGAQPLERFTALIDEELEGRLKPTRWVARVEAPKQAPRQAEDPDKIYKVEVAGGVTSGPANAPVTLVEFTDFQCPFCSRGQETVRRIMEAWPREVRVVSKNLPLDFHKRAREAAVASIAASRQGKYWEYRELLFANQKALEAEHLRTYAQQLSLDLGRFEKDLSDPALAAIVEADLKQAAELGVSGTPTFFLNGRKMVGAHPFESFKAAIERELAGGGGPAGSR